MDLEAEVVAVCRQAKEAARTLAFASTSQKNDALERIAAALRERKREIFEENAADVAAATERGTPAAMVDRLVLDERRLEAVATAVLEIRALEDPVGTEIARTSRPSGIHVRRVRAPIGVIAMVYESRPNVTIESAALALKAGNAIVLRGGSEARQSNVALARVLSHALEGAGLPLASAQVIRSTSRDAVKILVKQSDYVDLAIPRGGEALIRMVTEEARVPVVQHFKGVCHLFLDAGADLAVARRLVVDAKLSRPSACNALECLLVDESDAARLLPPIAADLVARGCTLHVDERAAGLLGGLGALSSVAAATDDDWGHEYLDRVLAVRIVGGIGGALDHVARYGSCHTEAICTANEAHAARWTREVDAACVAVNVSTRFHDGGELGLGAEIGIATSRLHWRGPMGLESLTTMKWIVTGEGQTRH